MKRDLLGDKLKAKERALTTSSIPPDKFIYVRVDGRGFSTLTRKLTKPYDENFQRSMIQTCMTLVKKFNAVVGYVQSDEISLVLEAKGGEHIFDGKILKLCSTTAGLASTALTMNLIDNGLGDLADQLPHFDSRLVQLDTKRDVAEMLMWRTKDAMRNATTLVAHSKFSHKMLQGKTTKDKVAMLAQVGVDMYSYPESFRKGQYVGHVVREVEVDKDSIPAIYVPESGRVSRTFVEPIDLPNRPSLQDSIESLIDVLRKSRRD